ncbi:hypothetical protein FBU31_004777 [Coemansia sp. 'formosensis']|nr:hypothetical protein FBU31_004777 [Coemansia sp. 'formosensis']
MVTAKLVVPELIQPPVIIEPADELPVGEPPAVETRIAVDAKMDGLSVQFSKLQVYAMDLVQKSPQAWQVVLLHPFIKLPASAHDDDAGYDVEMPATVILQPGIMIKELLGLAIEVPEGTL